MAVSSPKQTPENNSDAANTDSERDKQHPAECDIGKWKPAMLNMCANMPLFTGVYSVSALMTSTLSTYVNSQVTTLERHFGFSSTQTGLIMAANDVGFLVIVLFISFIATKVHIPRALGCFTLLYGISGIVCALPQFLFGAPSLQDGADVNNISAVTSGRPSGRFQGQLCDGVSLVSWNCSVSMDDSALTSQSPALESKARAHSGTALVILVVGMILQGVAKAPRGSFIVCYVDSNVVKVKTGFYMGIIIAVAMMGPAIAFALGGMFTRIYVTLEDTDLHYRHPGWIGAWWLGYITFGCAACVVALPLFCFPRRIKGGKPRTEPEGVHTRGERVTKGLIKYVQGFVAALIRLLRNPVYMCAVLSSCSLLFSGAGSQSFTPKYIENQFGFPAWKANMAIAGVMLATACLGTFVGGYLSKRLKMGPLSGLKFATLMSAFIVLFSVLQLLFKCEQPYLYNSPGPRAVPGEKGLEGCVDSCACDDGDYFPVCGQDGRTFFSPCHAGCQDAVDGSYVNCTCVEEGKAVAGMCDYSCVMFYPFIACLCLGTFHGTLAIIPKLIIYVRAVEERDKALALGFSSFMTSVTGWMLGPIYFGKMIDGICIQWERSCTGGGACLLYDNDIFRLKLLGYQAIFQVLSLVLVILAYIFARVTKRFEVSNTGLPKGSATEMTAITSQTEDDGPTKEDFTDQN
ncbi:hypothetical protein ACOMHN_032457 [Nucella lapillus]